MDPLSISASVIAILGLADRLISLCGWYVNTTKDAPRDLRTIMIEAGSVKSVLQSLELFMSAGAASEISNIVESLKGSEGPLEGCRVALAALEKMFPSEASAGSAEGKRRMTTTSYARLAWPFKEEKARKLLNDITQYKTTISLVLTTDAAHDIKNVKVNVKRLCDAMDLDTREKVLKWLVTTDPSPNHNAARRLRDPQTSNWLTKSPEYEDWKSGSTRFFWLHGIPGSGKTVLFSYIVEDIKQHCKAFSDDDVACTYYYCYFGRAQDELPHLLRWIINQLCRKCQYVPEEIQQCFRAGEEPAVSTLVQALSTVLRNFRHVYLMIDALDESLERQNLLRLLTQFAGVGFEKIKIFAMSREEVDIERAIGTISTHISLSNPYVEEDIRVYVQNKLGEHHKLRAWPETLKVEIEAALVKGSEGMFRWTACQIDILGRLHTISDIRKALNELPKTMDETYERILVNIPAENRHIAHKVLQLLAFYPDEFEDLGCLAEAVVVDLEQHSFTPESRLLDPNAILDICTCLITHTSEDEVKLAHYSVKEYLVSERIQCGPAKAFYISEAAVNFLAAKTALVYLICVTGANAPAAEGHSRLGDEQGDESAVSDLPVFRFLHWALNWPYYAMRIRNGPDKALIDRFVAILLDSNRPSYVGYTSTPREHISRTSRKGALLFQYPNGGGLRTLGLTYRTTSLLPGS